MKLVAAFQVHQTAGAGKTPLLTGDLYHEANVLAFEAGFTSTAPSSARSFFAVLAPPDHPQLSRIIEVIRRSGWQEVYDQFAQLELQQYRVRVNRHYEEADLNSCEFLYLSHTWGEWPLSSFCGRQGERWVGDALRVGVHSDLGWKQPIGSIDGLHNFFVSQKVLDAFTKEKVLGLRVHELLWNEPQLAKAKFWEIDSQIVMPACLLPVLECSGNRFYAEGPFDPPELRFLAAEVSRLGSFDIARCAESIAILGAPNRGGAVFVVSQRFRQILRKLGLLDDVRMFPVRLV
jgi:hypothetical protein